MAKAARARQKGGPGTPATDPQASARAPAAETVYPKGGDRPANEKALLELRQQLDQRIGALRTERMSWWDHWREVADYLIPRRYKWLVTPNQSSRGSPINQRIIDNTGTIALRVLAAGMMAGITSPGRPWFRFTLDDPELAESGEVKRWLDECATRMRTVFAESNFYTSLHQMYEDLGSFGTATLIIYEDFEDVIRCYNSCAGEYFLANSQRMQVDTMARQFVMTTAQIGREFGTAVVSPTVKQALEQKGAMLSRELIVNHVIEPNVKMVAGEMGPKGMPYRESYWEHGSPGGLLLRMRGFHEIPFVAPRWSLVGNDAYGRGPGMDALGDIKQLQVEQKRKAQGIDKMVNPPMVAHPNMKNEPASLLPGGITYDATLSEKGGMRSVYTVNPQLGDMKEDIKEVQQRVRSTFFSDLFLMISQLDTVRTASEIDARREEKLIQLGPVLERFENECLDPAIDRVFGIMYRAKLLPPPPKQLQGRHIKVEYISMLAQAQNAAMTAGIERVFAFAGNIAAAKPDVLDNLDEDEGIAIYSDMIGAPSKIVRDAAAVAAIRKAKAQAAAKQEALQTSAAAVQGAQVLSQTDTGGGINALSRILGTDKQGAPA